MVKNRALKRDARLIKASAGITYPRARDLLTDPVDQDTLVPSLLLGYGTGGGNIVYRPGKGTVLVIAGYSGAGTSVLMNRLAAEAADVASVHVIDVAKDGTDYRNIQDHLASLETTAAGALARVRALAAPRTTPSVVFIDYFTDTANIPGFSESLEALSASGVPVIVGSQLPHRSLPAALMGRADRVLIGNADTRLRMGMLRNPDAPVSASRYEAVYESAAGTVKVMLPPGGQVPRTGYQFEFGTDATGHPAAFAPALDLHLYVSGPIGSGKTTFLNALAADAAASMDVYFSNAAFPTDEIRTPATVKRLTTHQQVADMLDELLAEIAARRSACHEAGVGRVAELPEPPRPIMIVMDEFQWLLHSEDLSMSADPEVGPLRTRIAIALGRIARESRMAGVSLVMASQTDDALRLIPGETQLKTWLSRLALGAAKLFPRWGADALRDPQEQRQGLYKPSSRSGGHVDITRF